jgi:hypothetical protein
MAKKKNFLQVAIDNLKEALQRFSYKEAVESRDKRSIKRGKKLVKEISKQYTDKEAAQALEISRQKYTALKQGIKKGKVASSTLNDLLETTKGKLSETTSRPRDMVGDYISDKPIAVGKFKIGLCRGGWDYVKKT